MAGGWGLLASAFQVLCRPRVDLCEGGVRTNPLTSIIEVHDGPTADWIRSAADIPEHMASESWASGQAPRSAPARGDQRALQLPGGGASGHVLEIEQVVASGPRRELARLGLAPLLAAQSQSAAEHGRV